VFVCPHHATHFKISSGDTDINAYVGSTQGFASIAWDHVSISQAN
jgi:hypothetical protein